MCILMSFKHKLIILNFDVEAKDRICVQGHSFEDPPIIRDSHIHFILLYSVDDLFVRTRAFLTLGLWLGRGARSGGERPGLKKTNGRQIWAGRFLCALPITEHPRTTRGNAGTREEKEEEEEGGCVALNGFRDWIYPESAYTLGICLGRAPNPRVNEYEYIGAWYRRY